MEEIKTNSNNILAIEGKIRGCKVRIILIYMDSTKKKSGRDYNKNRQIQCQAEKLFEVDPDVSLICLGDLNGRLKKLEPNIETDENGKMIENWTIKCNLNHLNQSEDCVGTYTFNTKNGKSAIDHMLVNDIMFTGFKGMHIDEEKMLLDISDHCLVRAWFKISPIQRLKKEKPTYKNLSWIKRDEESYERFKISFKKLIGKKLVSINI